MERLSKVDPSVILKYALTKVQRVIKLYLHAQALKRNQVDHSDPSK